MVLVLLVVTVLHSSALKNEFYFDDRSQILEGRLNRSWQSVKTIFTSEVWRNVESGKRLEQATVDTFRPLFNLSLLLDYQIAGVSPPWYHGGNLVIHLLNVLLMFVISRRFFSDAFAVFMAFLFGLHPATVTCIHYVSARPDSASTLFGLATVALAIETNGALRFRLPLMAVAFMAAILWKETALLIPVVVLLLYWTGAKKFSVRNASWMAGILLGTLVIYFALRWNALKSVKAIEDSSHLLTMVFNYPRILLHWAAVTLQFRAPMPLHAFETAPPPFSTALLLTGIGFYLLSGAAIVLGAARKWLSTSAIVWILVSMAPPVAAMVRTDRIDGHYFYPSAAGTVLLFGALMHLPIITRVHRNLKIALGTVLLITAGMVSVATGQHFRTEVSFYRGIMAQGPHSPIAAYNLANALMRRGQNDEAIVQYHEVLKNYPGHPRAGTHNNLSVALLRTGQIDAALVHAREAVSQDSENDRYQYNLALAHAHRNDWSAAGETLERAITLNPAHEGARHLKRQICASSHQRTVGQLCQSE